MPSNQANRVRNQVSWSKGKKNTSMHLDVEVNRPSTVNKRENYIPCPTVLQKSNDPDCAIGVLAVLDRI